MQKLRVHNFAVSLDGYAAGPSQDHENPLGKGGMALHQWFFSTQTFARMNGQEGAGQGIDNDFAARCTVNVGAWVLGRNMFGPVRGVWPDESWKGWWGENPPFHAPVYVLTHHPRQSLPMQGGTDFHFVTEGIEAALARAIEAAHGCDVILGGGVSTIQQYLRARLIDEMHFVVVPVLLGCGEPLFNDVDLPRLGYEVSEHASSDKVTHVVIRKRSALRT
ncbi:MAG TPA: dihydrofolate reductase family protein [Pirellulales bacterium]